MWPIKRSDHVSLKLQNAVSLDFDLSYNPVLFAAVLFDSDQ